MRKTRRGKVKATEMCLYCCKCSRKLGRKSVVHLHGVAILKDDSGYTELRPSGGGSPAVA